ncbi:riboflavin synthase [Cytobacillus sp. Hz8]|uniref:riboflavin synthase n=1 Tax=Cytobacillus sp. Hz8 TaxID=3347168 RepID=UPI0035D6EB15
MFTGIVEEMGTISAIKQTRESIVMTIGANTIFEDMATGASIAVNGVCLTVTSFTDKSFSVDVMPETFRATGLKVLKRGSKVNLERAMGMTGRFGGHFVSGHVDGVGRILKKTPVDNAVYYEIEAPEEILHYIILKGSVAIDGTSLTVFGLSDSTFTISLIPHTLDETVIGMKGSGEIVNLECDMLSKYVAHFLSSRSGQGRKDKQSNMTMAFLEEHGFN